MTRRHLIAAVLVLASGAAAWWQVERVPARPPAPNILLITLDTTRADRLGAYGYGRARTPTLDQLAREGVLFEHARTATPTTLPAHVSLFTGLYPASHGVRNNGVPFSDTVPTLASALHDGGYRTAAFISSFVLDRRFGLARGFDHYDDRLDARSGVAAEQVERRGDRTAAAAEQWLASGPAPFFVWIHLYDPHDPYDPPPPFRGLFADQPYDGEIAFADSVIGSLVALLEQRGLSSSTLVAVMGDHGESLDDHGEATHGMFVYESAMRVPAILRWPGHLPAGRRVAPLVRSIDLAPTLIELAGLPAMAGIDGQSLMPLTRGEAVGPSSAYGESYFPLLFMNWSPLRSIQDDRWKYIEAPEPELYDLATDPGEQTNLAARQSERSSAMLRTLVAGMAGRREVPPGAMPDREVIKKLTALGYVGVPAATSRADTLKRPDPKKMIGLFNRLRLANTALVEGRLDEAAGIARDALAIDRENAFAMLIVAKAEMAQGRYRGAADHYRSYLAHVPTSADAHQWLAICLLQLGDEGAALREVDAALAIDPRFADAHELRGGLLSVSGHTDESVREFHIAVELNPDRSAFRIGLGRAFLNTGHPDQAETEFRRALALQPGRHEVRLDLARALERLGRRQEAVAEYHALMSGSEVAAELKRTARERLAQLGK
ncbi:MAG: sulfatase-like hydrolase/transferase [Vicinamibacterales bacterium]